jgi:hypothetical protein
MDSALVSALSALGGSVIGGLISGVAAVSSQRVQARANILANEIARREDLYKDFIMAASAAYGDALLTNEPKVDKLVSLYALVGRMRVLLPSQIVDCADRVMVTIVETYFVPNRTVREVHELMKSRDALIDPIRQFSELARNDIAELRSF